MTVYSISDLHLSGVNPKPMNIFGEGWEGHFEKICADWNEKVSDEEKIKLGLDSNYLKHDAFTINEIKTILDSVDKEKIKQDGKVLITYPGTDNYAMISLNQYNLLENALRERIEKMENVYKTLEKLTDESEI